LGKALALGQSSFNRGRPERVSSDAGLLLGADTLHASGIIEALSEGLHDPRRQDRVGHDLATLLPSSCERRALVSANHRTNLSAPTP